MERISTNCSLKFKLNNAFFIFPGAKKKNRSIKNVKKTETPNEVKIYNEHKIEIKKNCSKLWKIILISFCLILVIFLLLHEYCQYLFLFYAKTIIN